MANRISIDTEYQNKKLTEYIGEPCKVCGIKTRRIESFGDPKAKIMILGLCPSLSHRSDSKVVFSLDIEKWPRMFGSGGIIREVLKDLGKDFKDYYWTNLVKCAHSRDPSKATISNCSYFLNKEIEKVNPSKIIALGNVAYDIVKLMNLSGIEVIKLYHPAYVLRNPSYYLKYLEDFGSILL